MQNHAFTEMQVHGIFNCYKSPRITSRTVVDVLQRQLRPAKVGHAGTLDPLAEGVLVVAVGAASRLIPYLHEYSKTYRARFELGRWSDSADLETEVVEIDDAPRPTREQIDAAAKQLTGRIQQVPPLYSAVKIGGKRAYDAARKNQLLQLASREVEVVRFDVLRYEYPSVWVEIECGTGTYIRSLAVDLAHRLGTKGLMSHLIRTRVGPFAVEDSIRVDAGLPENFLESIRPLSDAVGMLPKVVLSNQEVVEIDNGRTIARDPSLQDSEQWAAVDAAGVLRAILVAREGRLGPKRVFRCE
jgi:tRNA pseudouridine55 synthase